MKKENYLEIALCLASSIGIITTTCLLRERNTNKKNILEKDQDIDKLKKDIDDLNFMVAKLNRDQKEIKDVILKQDRLIEILKEHFDIPNSHNKKTNNVLHLIKK